MKVTFIGAGSTVFARNIIGDCMCTEALKDAVFALYDIDPVRLEQSRGILEGLRPALGSAAEILSYCGEAERKDALRGADFVICAFQIGGFEPCARRDLDVPKRYGLRQIFGDTVGIGAIFRALRTVPVLEAIAAEMEALCPSALFMNYVNPMAILTGYMQRYTKIRTVGLCHSVQVCTSRLFGYLGMEEYLEGRRELIAGINHMAWLLEIRDREGRDLYPEIRSRAKQGRHAPDCPDLVRLDILNKLGWYVTESSLHQAEYSPFYIKRNYPELLSRFAIDVDEYPKRIVRQREAWEAEYAEMRRSGRYTHNRSHEYASRIMEAVALDRPYRIGGNVLNTGGLIENLPQEACVEVPCMVDGTGVHPCRVGRLPTVCAAMNMSNINMQLLTIEALRERRREGIYQAAMLDPHTAAELSVDDIRAAVDELLALNAALLPDLR